MTGLSSRLTAVLAPNPLTRAMARLRDAGSSWLDLTETNPTVVGLPYPDDLLRPLGESGGLTYAPSPRASRRRVRRHLWTLRTPRVAPSPERIVPTASTSEGYAWLFAALRSATTCSCRSRAIRSSTLLTGLEAVRAAPYRLEYQRAVVDRSRKRGRRR